MKILISDPMSKEGLDFLQQQENLRIVNLPGISQEDLLEEIRDSDALIVRSKTKVTEEVINAADKLKVIGRAGAGVDNIDLVAATRRGIVVMNTPGGNSISAGEHAFALLVSLARQIPFAHNSLCSGAWNKSAFTGRELFGKTMGILGLGKIGSVVAKRALGFEMKVLAYDPFVSEAYATDLGVELASLEQVLAKADCLSLHLPMNEKTKHLIQRDTIEIMKEGALIVNAARGPLIKEDDLLAAIDQGKLGGAALDVFENEPNISEDLRTADRVVLTPHIAGSTKEAQAKVGSAIAIQITNYLNQGVISNAVNFPSLTSKEQTELEPYIRLGEKLGSLAGTISRIRLSEIGIRYYGELAKIKYKPLSNYILKAILSPILSQEVNPISARSVAADRGISVIETVSSRERSYSNLISIQLRSPEETEWVEGAILREGNLRLVSIDGIPAETQLGNNLLFIRNEDKPGVIGQLGTVLGDAGINIGSFVLGRSDNHSYAVGIVNSDAVIPKTILEQTRRIPAIRFAEVISLE